MSDLSTRVRLRREQLGLSQQELARRMGYRSRSSITKLEKGINDIPQAKLEELAAALETTPAYLLGLDAPCPPPGFEPLPAMAMVPLVGSIACGTPITAEQNIECYIGVPAAWHADFALTCHGDSMSPTICNGDIVCIRCQPEVEQGEIAAVRVGEEATLKHFHRQGDAVMLLADNAAVCPPMFAVYKIRKERSSLCSAKRKYPPTTPPPRSRCCGAASAPGSRWPDFRICTPAILPRCS